ALAIRRKVLGEAHATYFSCRSLANCLDSQDKPAEALPYFQMAFDLARKVHGEAHPYALGSGDDLALVLQLQREFARAQPILEKGLALRRKGLGEDHPDTVRNSFDLATCL